MKATTIILAAIFTLSMNVIFASSDGAVVNNNINSSTFATLAPSTPTEATFEEMTNAIATLSLAPVTPIEADFSDVAPEVGIDFSKLAPVTPSEADFSFEEILMNDTMNLAPITPSVADFSENI